MAEIWRWKEMSASVGTTRLPSSTHHVYKCTHSPLWGKSGGVMVVYVYLFFFFFLREFYTSVCEYALSASSARFLSALYFAFFRPVCFCYKIHLWVICQQGSDTKGITQVEQIFLGYSLKWRWLLVGGMCNGDSGLLKSCWVMDIEEVEGVRCVTAFLSRYIYIIFLKGFST